jgi:hypothetical protein
VRTADELDALPDRTEESPAGFDDAGRDTDYPIRLSGASLRTIGGVARRIPDVRHAADLTLLETLSRSHPALGDRSGWSARFGRELNATEDRASFGSHGLEVIEGKHLTPFSVDVSPAGPRIDKHAAVRLLPDRRFEHARLGYRDVSGVGNRLSLIAAVIPAGVVTTHTIFCLRTPFDSERQHFLCGLFNSWVLNAIVRMLMGGHVTTSLVEGLPVPPWTGDDLQRRIARLARALARRPKAIRLAAELQASVARLYALDAQMFSHVLSGFPLVPETEKQRALDEFLRYIPQRCPTTALSSI